MAKRKFTSKARPRRNSSTPADHPGSVAPKLALEALIEAERRRLQKAHSVLSCVVVAFDSGEGACEIDFADAVDAARSLVGGAIGALDSVNLSSRLAEE